MDSTHKGPEEHGHDSGDFGERGGAPGGAGPPRSPRDALTPDRGGPVPARVVQLVSGDFLLTVNPVDGSEIEPCPPGEQPPTPRKSSPTERAELSRSAQRPLAPSGEAGPGTVPPLLERQEERERLVRLLARGRSVRLTGPAGSGRSSLLDTVADDCADLAPDGVIRLSGHRRTAADLLFDLYTAAFTAERHRPDRGELLELVSGVGAVVVVDDLEFGGPALDELLDATPECAFLLAATPDVAAPSPDSHLEEVFLGGLSRSGGLELLERCVDRTLTDDEAAWAGDLWFESEGLPLRFVQAGALLRQRDQLRADPEAFDAYGYYDGPGAAPHDAPFDAEDGHDVPLPSIAEGAAPAVLLASRLSESARATLRFAVALGGEVPHQAHLPALVGDTHADAALGELVGVALVTPVGARHRLAAGVLTQLLAGGYGDDSAERAHTAAQHYAWWAGHPSVTPERAVAEADALLAALTAQVPGSDSGQLSTAVLLARTAAPAFAAGLGWSAWERALRTGLEAARLAGEVAEEAYFHHDLGILALLGGQLDRARAELEASIGMRGVLADKRGTVAGRRALALVADRSGGAVHGGRTPAGEEVPAARYEESASPPRGVPAALPFPTPQYTPDETLVTRQQGPVPGGAGLSTAGTRRTLFSSARRNLAAAGAGALLAAVLGTVVTLGATSGEEPPPNSVKPDQSASEDGGDGGLPADRADKDTGGAPATTRPGNGRGPDVARGTARPDGTGEPGDPSGTADPSATPDPSASGTQPSSPDPTTSDDPDPTSPDPTTPKPTPTPDPDPATSEPTTPDPEPTTTPEPEPEPTTEEPPETSTASAPTSSTPVKSSAPASSSSAASSPSGSGTVI